jgi:hypothetical protein
VGGNWAGAPDGTTPWPAEMKVDYVKAWNLPDPNYKPTPGAPSPTTPPAPEPTLPPPPSSGAGQVLTSSRYGDVLAGGSGADTITAGQGPDQLTGGGGSDVFVFKDTPWNAGRIKDFVVGTDRLDLSHLPNNGALAFESDGAGGTRVLLDVDGPGGQWPYQIVTLEGVSPVGLTAAKLYGPGVAPAPGPNPPAPTVTS